MDSITSGIFICIVIAIITKWCMKARYKLPPGPRGLPFIGVSHQIDKRGWRFSADKWAAEYGNIVFCKLYGDNVVILNDYESIYESLVTQGDCFAGRPSFFKAQIMLGPGIIFLPITPRWSWLKKVAMMALKPYGIQQQLLEEKCNELTDDMLDKLDNFAESGEPFDMKPIFHRCITEILSALIYARKMEEQYISELLHFHTNFNESLASNAAGLLLDFAPITRFFPCRKEYNKVVEGHNLIRSVVGDAIEEARKRGSTESCFIDEILKYQSTNSSRPEVERLTDEDISAVLLDMTVAGTITSSLTLHSMVSCLVNLSEVQEKVAQEIKEVIGARLPLLQDKQVMPYTEAMILETLRYQSMVALNVAHATVADTQLQGYDIPKGTIVYQNLWKMHHDPQYWEEPWQFKPERFIQDGMVVPADHPCKKRLLAFGAGRRACVAELFAKNRMFLLVARLLQHFQLLPESDDKRPSHDPRTYLDGIDIAPMPYNIKVKKRDY